MSNSGAMRDVIRIERRSSVQDSSGEESPTWILVAERRGEKIPSPGREVFSSNQRTGFISTVFKMRWPGSFEVKPQMRLVCKGRIYNITSAIDVDGRGVDMFVTCEELVNEPVT